MLAALFRFADQSSLPSINNEAAVAVNTAVPPPATVMPAPVQEQSYLSGEGVILQREGDGHFYANAKLQGSDIRFLVDTGATAVALTGKDAEALGLYWNPGELTKVGRGVSGDVMGKPVIIPSIQVGDLHAENVQAAIIPEGLDVSLLGQSFLSKVGTLNISNDRMTLQ